MIRAGHSSTSRIGSHSIHPVNWILIESATSWVRAKTNEGDNELRLSIIQVTASFSYIAEGMSGPIDFAYSDDADHTCALSWNAVGTKIYFQNEAL